MLDHDIIVIGASAGGVSALQALVKDLPPTLPAALFIVLHIPPERPSHLPHILSRAGPLPAAHAQDGEAITSGRIYVAPPDHHLLLEREQVRVTRGPKENRMRPAVDTLFRSAAYTYGPRVIGVVLSGSLTDGTAGLWAVKYRGGIAVVQAGDEALYPGMPQSAMQHVAIDYQLPVAEIASLLVRLSREAAAEEGGYPVSEAMEIETQIAREDNALEAGVEKLGRPSSYTCPDCHGSLLQIQEGGLVRFRCHTGHAFSPESLLAELTTSIDDTLWTTIRAVEESVRLLQQFARQAKDQGDGLMAERLQHKAREAQQRADLVRQAALHHEALTQEKLNAEVA
jgi:two-component system, chemotaxis family, protein-glutamate methylesterase/glutaminase